MRKYLLLAAIPAAVVFSASAVAQPTGDRFSGPLRSSSRPAGNPSLSVDVNQYTPEGQIQATNQNTKSLLDLNQQLVAQLAAIDKKLDEMEGRLKAVNNALNTTSGETIGAEVNKLLMRSGGH